jgi:hypothetical protein
MLLQAYDFVELYRREGCTFQAEVEARVKKQLGD